MPRYYFDTDNGKILVRDDTGIVLDGPTEASHQSMTSLLDMVKGILFAGDRHKLTTTVRDTKSETIFTATMKIEGRWHGDPPGG